MRKYSTQYDYMGGKPHRVKEVIYSTTLTTPNQSLSVSEIIRRSTMGLPVPGAKDTYFDGDDNFDSIDPTLSQGFDLVDADELQRSIDKRSEERKHKKSRDLEDQKQKDLAANAEAEKQAGGIRSEEQKHAAQRSAPADSASDARPPL